MTLSLALNSVLLTFGVLVVSEVAYGVACFYVFILDAAVCRLLRDLNCLKLLDLLF